MTAEQFLKLNADPLEKYKKLYRFAVELSNKAHFMKGYGDLPYQAHLFDVEYVIIKFGYGEETVEGYQNRIAARLHDILEDCGFSYNSIKKIFGEEIAEMVFLCQDHKGRDRKARKPDSLYEELRTNPRAVIIKLGDRIANVMGGEMNKTYIAEHPRFKEIVYEQGVGEEMWKCLDIMLKPKEELQTT